MKNLFAGIVFFSCLGPAQQVSAQADTILVYDISTQTTATILPVAFNPTVTSDFTSSSLGSMGNMFPLSLVPPLNNLFQGAGFTKLARAADFFNLTNYPMRTVVRIKSFYNDSIDAICTGMIVSPCLVLTSAICVCSFSIVNNFLSFDSIRVSPAFNNGVPQAGLPTSVVKKIYMFKKFYNNNGIWQDMTLLELKDPIGLQTGWTGIGFNSNQNFSAGNVYHKFSYPASYQYNDSSKYYNGDTLYYNYGTIVDNPNNLLIPSAQAVGISGQGGSTFMFTDNVNYYSLGALNFSNNYYHSRYGNAAFYQMKNVIDNLVCPLSTASIHDQSGEAMGMGIYPNPLTAESRLEFSYDGSKRYELKIINSLGQVVSILPVTSGRIALEGHHLSKGIYLLQLSAHTGERSTGKLIVD
jgi:hypothetical protein